jgi:hypothetical protein
MEKTSKKRPAVPFKGAIDGTPFTTENQPAPELKKAGWEQWRKERHLTQSIIREMIGEDGKPNKNLKAYIGSLIVNAKMGNSKAIETINKCLEDDIIKHALTDTEGNNVIFVLDERFRDKED